MALTPANVPSDLRHLVPLAERWGLGDDLGRGEAVEAATERDRQELHDALYEPFERITAWLDSFGGELMPEEPAAFMYMQLALNEMGVYILDEKRRAGESR